MRVCELINYLICDEYDAGIDLSARAVFYLIIELNSIVFYFVFFGNGEVRGVFLTLYAII